MEKCAYICRGEASQNLIPGGIIKFMNRSLSYLVLKDNNWLALVKPSVLISIVYI